MQPCLTFARCVPPVHTLRSQAIENWLIKKVTITPITGDASFEKDAVYAVKMPNKINVGNKSKYSKQCHRNRFYRLERLNLGFE